jgi:HD superfamily phosphohydrolase
MRTLKRIRTVLYGDQKLTAAELEVIHTPAMQRLYSLKQLGLTDRIFIDASHSRLHHVVGALHQVDKLVSAIVNNLGGSNRKLQVSFPDGKTVVLSASSLARYVRGRKCVIRFIALLHDLTHAPFGHTIEDEIRLVDTGHDEPERQAEAFHRLLCQLIAWLALEAHGPDWSGFPSSLRPFLSQGANVPPTPAPVVGAAARQLINGLGQPKASLCLRLSPKYIAEMLAHLGYAMTALLHLEALHATEELRDEVLPSKLEYPFQEIVRTALEETEFAYLIQKFQFDRHRDAFMLDIVGNTVCADLLDYAGRDSHYAGLRLNYDPDRIAENFTLVHTEIRSKKRSDPNRRVDRSEHRRDGKETPVNPFEGWCLRTAISLVSHKYRTDVPSELMNLLNVRFYLYERVIFHSTKCAAGSMLGTALQLLGWRKPGNGRLLPKHLEFVGDDVFLHDIAAALDLLVDEASKLPKEARIDGLLVQQISGLDRMHNGLASELVKLRVGQQVGNALNELNASRLLLNRLMSRRYFRPVFRALPNTGEDAMHLDADELAALFSDPDFRYDTERDVEEKATLPKGTITIHCPKRNTAEKVANVLLTKPGNDGMGDSVCALNCIGEIDRKTFGEHEEAVRAVQKMYKSMWRLTVYSAPEHMERWREISQAAGQAIFQAVARKHNNALAEKPDRRWPNDPDLNRELEGKTIAASATFVGESGLTIFGEDLGRAADQLIDSGRIGRIPAELYDEDWGLTELGRKQIENALTVALAGTQVEKTGGPPKSAAPPRVEQVLTIARSYIKRIKGDDVELFQQTYGARLDRLPEPAFQGALSKLKSAASRSVELDAGLAKHKGSKLREFKELLESILLRMNSPKSLFGAEDSDE